MLLLDRFRAQVYLIERVFLDCLVHKLGNLLAYFLSAFELDEDVPVDACLEEVNVHSALEGVSGCVAVPVHQNAHIAALVGLHRCLEPLLDKLDVLAGLHVVRHHLLLLLV